MCHSDNSEAHLLLRSIEPADVTFLTDLWVASWQETMPGIDFAARRPCIAGVLANPAYRTLVAVADAPLGFVTLEGAYLHQLVVAPAAKGRGVASRLLDAAKTSSPVGLDLDVNQANFRAVRFYECEGFVTTGAGRNPTSGLATWHMRWAGP